MTRRRITLRLLAIPAGGSWRRLVIVIRRRRQAPHLFVVPTFVDGAQEGFEEIIAVEFFPILLHFAQAQSVNHIHDFAALRKFIVEFI